MKIYHIAAKVEYNNSLQGTDYKPVIFQKMGFIGCALPDQILTVANTILKDAQDLIILRINTVNLTSPVEYRVPYETPLATTEFPHIMGPLNISAVEKTFPFERDSDGHFVLPENLAD
ncbi:MAG: DUF952 domain-containing protein [Bacteriovoracaceae bacterium]|jgi:uncharacterized protein (DUF952 family)|nr:DUF952 domain-containing protein [Bacteriovoracaceae bacterium]